MMPMCSNVLQWYYHWHGQCVPLPPDLVVPNHYIFLYVYICIPNRIVIIYVKLKTDSSVRDILLPTIMSIFTISFFLSIMI
jgi:hypothetical protein